MTPSNHETIVDLEDLVVRLDDLTAVDVINFSVRRGDIFEFLGLNGDRETTTIRNITTIQRPTSDRVSISDHEISKEYLEARWLISIV